jgi:glucose/arabinose dehydrogenase
MRLILSILALSAVAAALPPGFQQTVVFSGAPEIIDFDWEPGGGLWIATKDGRVWLRRGGSTYLALTLAVTTESDAGISAITVDPGFATNNRVWIAYNTTAPSRTRLSRFVNIGTKLINGTTIVEHPDASSDYNGGCLRFLPDGTLFFATGFDGEPRAAQDPHDLRGKLLRLNPDGTAPADNPFADGVAGDPRVWAYGLRNPFRCAVQPGTGSLFIGDVGSEEWEEIDVPAAGANLGYPLIEGPGSYAGAVQPPLYSFPHLGGFHAVIAGDFGVPGNWPVEYVKDFLFADHNADKLLRLRFDQAGQFVLAEDWFAAPQDQGAVSLRFGPDGALYYVAWQASQLRRIAYLGGAGTGGRVAGLRIAKSASPAGSLSLAWQASCQLGDHDYSIVEGSLGHFADWNPKVCSTSGKTAWTVAPSGGSAFYLVVPHDGVTLGSFGTTSAGAERVPQSSQCRPQQVNPCGVTPR